MFELFTNKVAEYTASRPDYPAALFDEIASLAALSATSRIADIGAGTGIFSQGLLSRGYTVVAVEPNAAMRSAAGARLHQYPGYSSVSGTAEATTLRDASVDLITAAQAFHWFDVEPARHECLRILEPHGKVALVWNDRVLADPLHAAMDEVFWKFGAAKRAARLPQEDRSHVDQFFAGAPFHTLQLAHEQRLDREGLVSLALSRSYMPARDSAEGAQVTREVAEIFASFADGDELTVPVRYQTVAMIGRPVDAAPRPPI
jgi:SAM-dependent methyltransferase